MLNTSGKTSGNVSWAFLHSLGGTWLPYFHQESLSSGPSISFAASMSSVFLSPYSGDPFFSPAPGLGYRQQAVFLSYESVVFPCVTVSFLFTPPWDAVVFPSVTVSFLFTPPWDVVVFFSVTVSFLFIPPCDFVVFPSFTVTIHIPTFFFFNLQGLFSPNTNSTMGQPFMYLKTNLSVHSPFCMIWSSSTTFPRPYCG